MKNSIVNKLLLFTGIAFTATNSLLAAPTGDGGGHSVGITLLWIAVLLIAAKLSSIVERFGQPSVLGELLVGVLLGNLSLIGIQWFEPIPTDTIIHFLAELGVVILLFQIGMESNLEQMTKVGGRAAAVAIIGVVVPLLLGVFIVPFLLPGLGSNAYLFIGATLTATSVGITARVFRDLGKLQAPESQIVLGAAVIDDILGLIILAVVSAIVKTGAVDVLSVAIIILKAAAFLISAVYLGRILAPLFSRAFSKINTGTGMKFTIVITLGLVFAYLAEIIGLAPIIGAFAAGLLLDPVHFQSFEKPQIITDITIVAEESEPVIKERILKVVEHHEHHTIEELIAPLGHFFVPIFFVVTGMTVRLETLFDGPVLVTALGVTALAVVGKLIAGFAAGNVNKSIVGWGMVPRGEVGLIFATAGKALGVVTDEVFSVIVIMVILTTLMTPPILTVLLKRQRQNAIAA
ncbi:MAG TPA: cation:proton antiporter [Patescibacteria group bacterium]|nr:cation:proton antiporter [Patescibacteria group bacterium]